MLETSKRKKNHIFFQIFTYQNEFNNMNIHESIFSPICQALINVTVVFLDYVFDYLKCTHTSCEETGNFLIHIQNCIAACSIQTLFKYFS